MLRLRPKKKEETILDGYNAEREKGNAALRFVDIYIERVMLFMEQAKNTRKHILLVNSHCNLYCLRKWRRCFHAQPVDTQVRDINYIMKLKIPGEAGVLCNTTQAYKYDYTALQ